MGLNPNPPLHPNLIPSSSWGATPTQLKPCVSESGQESENITNTVIAGMCPCWVWRPKIVRVTSRTSWTRGGKPPGLNLLHCLLTNIFWPFSRLQFTFSGLKKCGFFTPTSMMPNKSTLNWWADIVKQIYSPGYLKSSPNGNESVPNTRCTLNSSEFGFVGREVWLHTSLYFPSPSSQPRLVWQPWINPFSICSPCGCAWVPVCV